MRINLFQGREFYVLMKNFYRKLIFKHIHTCKEIYFFSSNGFGITVAFQFLVLMAGLELLPMVLMKMYLLLTQEQNLTLLELPFSLL